MAHNVAVASNECHRECAKHTDTFTEGFDKLADNLECVALYEEGCGADYQAEGGVPDVLAAGRGQRLDPAEFEAGSPAHDRHLGK